jgi:hypothetical protein
VGEYLEKRRIIIGYEDFPGIFMGFSWGFLGFSWDTFSLFHTMTLTPCNCKWTKDHFRGCEECVRCGNQRDITHNHILCRASPITSSGNGMNRWLNHSAAAKLPSGTTTRDHSSDVNSLIDRYVMDEDVIESLGSRWDAFLKDANITPKRDRRKACIAVIILCNRSMWKGHTEIDHIRADIGTSDLYRAFKFIRGLECDLAKHAPDLESFKLEVLDWSAYFDETLWERALVFDQHLLRLNLKAYSQQQGDNVKWVRYSTTVVRAASVLMAFAETEWKPGMAAGGKYLKEITARILSVSELTTTATRTIRSPLIRLFPYIPILGDPSQVEDLLQFYRVREREMVVEAGAAEREAGSEESLLSNIRVSFVCGESRVCVDADVDSFENFVQDIAGGGRTEDTRNLPVKWNLRQKRSGKFLLTVRGRVSDVRELMDRFNGLTHGMYPPACYRICNQLTTAPMFENRTFVIADDIKDVCEEAGFDFVATKSTRIMLRYGSRDLAVFETGTVMIFGVLEGDDGDGDDSTHGLRAAIRALARKVGTSCIDSACMMGALVEFGNTREIWDTRTAYMKKKEKCL